MPRGPKPGPPIFSMEVALALRERYLQGETYKQMAESMGETPRRVDRALHQHGVISKEDTSEHYRVIMERRADNGVRVGRKPKPRKKKG